MSNRRHVRPPAARRRLEHQAALVVARLAGCTCRPDIATRHAPNLRSISVSHDDWCPARTAPSALLAYPTPEGNPQ